MDEAKDKTFLESESPRDSIAIDASIITEGEEGEEKQEGERHSERVIENITVVPQIKEYSSFTNQICLYLENAE